MDRRSFLGGAALGGGAVLVNVLSGSAATGAGDDADVDKRRTRPSRLDNITRSEQGMSAGGLSKARLARMHHVMAGYVERGEVPGIVTLVNRRGAVHVDAIGRQAIGGDVMRRDTIFRIASMTKPITAAATMILVEECKLRLDEPVDRLLPELANRKVKVLKRLDGPLDETVPATRLHRLAACYRFNPEANALELFDAANGQWSHPPAFPTGGGGLVSTIDDYAAFGQMMLNKGKYGRVRLLSRPTVEAMTTDQLTPEQKAAASPIIGASSGWGFGLSIVTKPDRVAAPPGRYGWNGGLGTSWWSDPKEEMVAIIMSQRTFESADPPSVCLDFWTSAYQAIDD